ncbi:MAG TPA: hypothetical protein VF209_03430 [Patescibacteria group bacterium]
MWQRHRASIGLLLSTWGLFFTILFSKIIELTPEGLYAGHVHVWGDWSLHVSLAHIFAYKSPGEWFINHPYYAGGKLTYPFLANMISGLLVRVGMSLDLAFIIPSIVFSLALLLVMYGVYYLVLRSQKGALLAVNFFLLASGPGFINWLYHWFSSGAAWADVIPKYDITRLEKEYQWLAGNFINGMLMPQRAFLIGMVLAAGSLVCLLYVMSFWETKVRFRHQQRILLLGGVLAAILPITHMHSFIALVIVAGLTCLPWWKKWQSLAWYVIPAGIISTILYFSFVAGGIENPNFMQIRIGWTAPDTILGWFYMWWRIYGVMIPLAMLSVGLMIKDRMPWYKISFITSFFVIFGLGNIIQFQPIAWDNSKLFLWSYFGFSAAAAYLIITYFDRKWLPKLMGVFLCLMLVSSGLLEIARLYQFDQNRIMMSSVEDIHLGEFVRNHTPESARFLTEPTHNHPVMMWGTRPILLGYPGWAWNFGFLYHQREADIPRMYQGGSAALELLRHYQIEYVVVGSGELRSQKANEGFFSSQFPIVYSSPHYRVYDVRSLILN